MFSLAYVMLPFSDTPPADAIRESLEPFQRGGRGDLPEHRIAFDDETKSLREAHETTFTFIDEGKSGFKIKGGGHAYWHLDTDKIRKEMRQRSLTHWNVRFADLFDLDTFFERCCEKLEKHPQTGGYGVWRNPLGHWDWWDLGGRFDGFIVGEPRRGETRGVAKVSSGPNMGRTILSNIEDSLRDALGQEPVSTLDVTSDRNIELAVTLLAALHNGEDHATPATLVLPPGCAKDNLRWMDTWPRRRPVETFVWLGVDPDAPWEDIVKAAYGKFSDHWVAGVAYHH